MNSELERSRLQLKQINEVIQEILDTGIPEEPEQLAFMIVILSQDSCIQEPRLRYAVWRLRQDLIYIAAVYQIERGDRF